MTARVQCPICQTWVEWSPAQRWRPFCSERCKQIDLGAWASDEYKIAGRADDRVDRDADRDDL
ncbi:MAG TPA: DNA gyrase inhibitor YacG [Burkholderiaceae bacterium]|nr:DNA gyrase inhibitor YacG [Burkholderiaceae bacterium]